MKNRFLVLLIFALFFACNNTNNKTKKEYSAELNLLLDNWHLLAANADINYFDYIANNGIYIGTATEEVWGKQEFFNFAKPYFDKGTAWDFKPYDRNIYFNKNADIAWFNERLDTWMGVCRGSGVLQKTETDWKIRQYTLSVSVPNEKIKDVISVIKGN